MTPESLVAHVEEHRAEYATLRPYVNEVVDQKPVIQAGFRKLAALYPGIKLPAHVYFVVGPQHGAGINSPNGIILAADVFANSLGVNTGPAAQVEIEFEPRVAPYVRARVWHASQQLREGSGGTLVLSMNVCHDWALRSWILSWGPFARVLTPSSLAKELHSDLEAAAGKY